MSLNYQKMIEQLSAPKAEFEKLYRDMLGTEIPAETHYFEFYRQYKNAIVKAYDYVQKVDKAEIDKLTLDELKSLNTALYSVFEPEMGYDSCLGNPDYSEKLYGKSFGPLLSAFYTFAAGSTQLFLMQNYLSLKGLLDIFFELFALRDSADYEAWLKVMKNKSEENLGLKIEAELTLRLSPQFDYYRDIILNADLSNYRYLYRYGAYISPYDLAMAEFMNSYPKDELQDLATFFVQCWIDGFERGQKDYRKKKYANLLLPAGMEALGRLIILELREKGIEPLVPRPMTNGINRQFGYDHRYDSALTLDREFMEKTMEIYQKSYENLKGILAQQAGPLYIELFGEQPFTPISKSSTLKLSEEQQALLRERSARLGELHNRYYRRDEASFSIISFPSPEIGENFADIFADTLKINLLDSLHYASIQQKIIDVLDTAEFVQVKGKEGNETDLMVRMHELINPEKETLFENCVADVNIPVGEVFTSPMLEGTNGVLHVEDIYLEGLRYYNLKIVFEDGWVKDYSCTNYEDEEENKKYIHENLLLPHESLPIGEFAIGTNTTAYQIAKKYDIMHLLPILITEKMGPHFAIGDTCYSHEEDAPHPSFLNGKEMIAVENEKSRTRKEDPINAYLMKHTDITLPYEMLGAITAIDKDGNRQDIIRDSRFVVPGTEELNIPLMGLD